MSGISDNVLLCCVQSGNHTVNIPCCLCFRLERRAHMERSMGVRSPPISQDIHDLRRNLIQRHERYKRVQVAQAEVARGQRRLSDLESALQASEGTCRRLRRSVWACVDALQSQSRSRALLPKPPVSPRIPALLPKPPVSDSCIIACRRRHQRPQASSPPTTPGHHLEFNIHESDEDL